MHGPLNVKLVLCLHSRRLKAYSVIGPCYSGREITNGMSHHFVQ